MHRRRTSARDFRLSGEGDFARAESVHPRGGAAVFDGVLPALVLSRIAGRLRQPPSAPKDWQAFGAFHRRNNARGAGTQLTPVQTPKGARAHNRRSRRAPGRRRRDADPPLHPFRPPEFIAVLENSSPYAG